MIAADGEERKKTLKTHIKNENEIWSGSRDQIGYSRRD